MANVALKYGFGGGGPADGVNPPAYITGNRYLPQNTSFPGTGVLTTTSTRNYYVPIYIWEIRSFAGLATINSGTGDNGDTFRLAIYEHDAANKGPGTLLKDVGEITLTGVDQVERFAANAFTPPTTGWYWLSLHCNQACVLYNMASDGIQITAVGYKVGQPLLSRTGLFSLTAFPTTLAALPVAYYVDTAYGAAPATAVQPTATTASAPVIALVA